MDRYFLGAMSDSDKGRRDGELFVGKGEFELRGMHVVATVGVRDGIVADIEFRLGSGMPIAEAERIADLLKGHTISSALQLKAEELLSIDDRAERAALLEAFHRAVESYLDNE